MGGSKEGLEIPGCLNGFGGAEIDSSSSGSILTGKFKCLSNEGGGKAGEFGEVQGWARLIHVDITSVSPVVNFERPSFLSSYDLLSSLILKGPCLLMVKNFLLLSIPMFDCANL